MERQHHGFMFEAKYIAANNLIKSDCYTSPFDAYSFSGIPYQIKLVKKGSNIELGDIFRNANMQQDFFLVVGFWENDVENVVEVSKLYIPYQKWNHYLHFEMYHEMKSWIHSVSNSHDYDSQWKMEMNTWKR